MKNSLKITLQVLFLLLAVPCFSQQTGDNVQTIDQKADKASVSLETGREFSGTVNYQEAQIAIGAEGHPGGYYILDKASGKKIFLAGDMPDKYLNKMVKVQGSLEQRHYGGKETSLKFYSVLKIESIKEDSSATTKK
jgi:hypothetical protein